MLSDDSFKLPTTQAEEALKSAVKLLEWTRASPETATSFAKRLILGLKKCFGRYKSTVRSFRMSREKMWGNFHKYATSDNFVKEWRTTLASVSIEPSPILYQYITDTVFSHLIKENFPVDARREEEEDVALDYQEMNALRYSAGYVIRAVRKKIKRSSHPLKNEIALCTEELIDMSLDDGKAY